MIKIVCYRKQPCAYASFNNGQLIDACLHAVADDIFIGFVLVDGLQFLLQEPGGGIEPLQEDTGLCQEQVPRMAVADVCPFVCQNGFSVLCQVVFGNGYLLHPTERSDLCPMDIQGDSVLSLFLPASAEQTKHPSHGPSMAEEEEKDA